ncbi:hypothetical protein M2191_003468 [Bradyrhizobium japonicum]|nr:hypothetical protein [Bradyrhizobium japonicum]
MRTEVVTVRVPVHVIAVRMQVVMKIKRMSAADAGMDVSCADRAPDPRQGENAEQDQHDADRKFHRQTKLRRDNDPEHDDRRTDRHDRDGVSYAPSGTDQRRARHAAFAADDRRDSDHMVGVGRMPHSEEEAEEQERQDIQGSSGHAHTLTWLSPGAIYQSGEIDRSGNISKCGDKLMRHALYEAANSHLRIAKKWSVLRAWGIKLAKRVGAKKGCVAVARKLAIIMHRMRVTGTEFRFGQPSASNAT